MNQVKEQTELAPHITLPNIIKHTSIPATTTVVNGTVQMSVERLRELKRQERTLKKLIETEEKIIKEHMGDCVQLLDLSGNEVATWKYDSDREELDKKALKLNFADVYYACTTIVAGSRKFLIKG